MWECKRCGDCCKFIVVPVEKGINIETIGYLEAHGIAYGDGKLIIPARCKYLTHDNDCLIHDNPFLNCRLAGKKECEKCKEEKKCLQSLKCL